MANRKPTGKEYTFKTVKDIVGQLELNQIDDFLVDFGMWLRVAKGGKSGDANFDKFLGELKEMANLFGKAVGEKSTEAIQPIAEEFKWKDDAIHKASVLNLVSSDGKAKTQIKFTLPKS